MPKIGGNYPKDVFVRAAANEYCYKIVKNAYYDFPDPKIMSSNCLFFSAQQSKTQKESVHNEINQRRAVYQREPENVWHICLKNYD